MDHPYNVIGNVTVEGDKGFYTFEEGIQPGETYRIRAQYLIKHVSGSDLQLENTVCKFL